MSSGAAPAAREVEAPAAGRGVVVPFPRRLVFAWMAAAAGLLMAVTLWSVARLGDRPVASVAMSEAPGGGAAPLAAPPASPPADSASKVNAPRSRLEDGKAVDRVAGQAPAVAKPSATRQEQDKRKLDSRTDALAMRQPAELAAAEAKQSAQAPVAPAGNARDIQLQTNTAAGGARPRGPLATQQANQQPGTQQQNVRAAAPVMADAPPPPPPATGVATVPAPAAAAPAAAPVAPPAQAAAGGADARERRANEEPPAQVAETVTITSPGTSARRAPARPQPERSQAAGAEREGQARSKDEAATFKAFGYVAAAYTLSSFAEPGGRLLWRIADGRRLESSSDGGTTWMERYTARGDRLRAGMAPSIDNAWAVGERGLVLRFTVPGGWTAVSRAGEATLIAVSATSAQAARVTADDGRVFQTADGGATWTPATSGAGPR